MRAVAAAAVVAAVAAAVAAAWMLKWPVRPFTLGLRQRLPTFRSFFYHKRPSICVEAREGRPQRPPGVNDAWWAVGGSCRRLAALGGQC